MPFKSDDHELISFFVYVGLDLWGQPFAAEQVRIESLRKGIVDYESLRKKTLALPAAERARRLQEFVGRSRIQ